MPTGFTRAAFAAAVLVATLAAGTPGAVARPATQAGGSPPVLDMELNHTDFQIPGPAVRRPGPLTFRATTSDASGHFLMLFRPRADVTIDQAIRELLDSVNPDPAVSLPAIRKLFQDVDFHGGLKVVAGIPVAFTTSLDAGTYYLAETPVKWVSGRPPYVLRSFRTVGVPDAVRLPRIDATVVMADTPVGRRFLAPHTMPHDASVLVVNHAAQPHELIIDRVRPGTTNADLRRYFETGPGGQTASPFVPNGTVSGLLNLSPGSWAILHVEVPAGEYAMLSFITDPASGASSTSLGMARTLRLRA